ncbi:hypothetical protein K7W42_21060 [Deinococcus sp. HMF7604]|uniref:hypothetical protein n=1 Tax=Deinococcus betulae TaxID=2873312 RepID=UPI001CCEED32|nr:hypothetical protein [Deinococcus betulae]MBZ9753328.1 hypothetical protein [Deinococcus betulae]
MSSVWIHYAEGHGEPAHAALRAWLATLPGQPGFLGAERLASPEQPALTLVASRWAVRPPDLGVPEGVRAWSFEVVERHEGQQQ